MKEMNMFNYKMSEAQQGIHAGEVAVPVQQNGSADCQIITDFAAGGVELSETEISGLLFMIEEEKMAMDLYDSFSEQTGSIIFDKISDSEQRHMDTLLQVAEAADVDVSGLATEPGVFSDPHIQELYDTLLAQGSTSLADALEVGILVEETDIEDLQLHSADVEVGLLGVVYDNLTTGSEHHLAAFTQYEAVA